MRTLRLWSQSHSKSLCRFTLKLSGLGAAVLNNKCNAFSYALISKALGCSHTCWKQKQARMDSRCRGDLTASELQHIEVKVVKLRTSQHQPKFYPLANVACWISQSLVRLGELKSSEIKISPHIILLLSCVRCCQVWDFLLLAFSWACLTSLGWTLPSNTLCVVGFIERYCTNLVLVM